MKAYPERKHPVPDVMKRGQAWVSLVATVAFLPVDHVCIDGGKGAAQVYVKVHPAVVLATCPACKAKPGELCRGRAGNRTVSCHADRKDQMYANQKGGPGAE